MAAVVAGNPFGTESPNRTVTILLDDTTTTDMLDSISGQDDEKIALGRREIYIAYGDHMGRSKLKIPAASGGTARNLNIASKLADMARSR